MMMRLVIFLLLVSCLVFLYYGVKGTKLPSTTSPSLSPTISTSVLGQRIKAGDCVMTNSLPDPLCTPGAADSTLTKDVICNPSFSTKSVRNVPSVEKTQVYREYRISHHEPGQYEVDHLIPLEIGGSNDIANLWPEPAEPRPGFHEKDKVENYLHDQVCSGAMDLTTAQQMIAHDWLGIYQTMQ